MNTLVSIIIPVYNREHLIINTLKSIIKQTYLNWECIIVDDGSKDDTIKNIKAFVKKDSRFMLISRPVHIPKGANGCRNYGLSKSSGKFVNWFDSDDEMHKDFLEKKVEALTKDKSVDLVLSKTVKVYKDKANVYENRTNLTKNLIEDYITRIVSWYLPDGMFRKDFLKDEFQFDEYLKGGQDRDFYVKVLIKNPKIVVLDYYATFYCVHDNSISGALYKKNKNQHIYNFSHFESLISQTKVLKKENLLSNRLKVHYFIEIKKKLPSVFYVRKKTYMLYSVLFKLSSINFFYIKQWVKIVLASLSFTILSKGEKLLK